MKIPIDVKLNHIHVHFLGKMVSENKDKIEKHEFNVDGRKYLLFDSDSYKILIGRDYNFVFSKVNGEFVRWGKILNDDPAFSPIGPEIWDCEVTTICQGVGGKVCQFCYKSNTPNGINMSFDNFKKMIDVFPKTLTQIAFGADSHATSNPDLFKMMSYCRERGIVPNITVADISDEIADQLKQHCGAVAISRYSNKDICYNSVKKLATDRKMTQINIHSMLSEETFDICMETAKDMMTDERLKDMNAIVFLGLKEKGRAKGNYNVISYDKFKELISFCLKNGIKFGFDSCSACRFEKVVREMDDINEEDKLRMIKYSESCEGGLYSFYTSVDCEYFPCSFTEGEKGWENGISMLDVNDFSKDVWYNPRNVEWRKALIDSVKNGCRQCLTFPKINV